MKLSPQQVLGLAPDASSAKAGQGLATSKPWSELGQDDRAVWGLCAGSGKSPYATQVDLTEPAFKCSCPSRKFPCKHAIGLLLLRASSDSIPSGARPDWVEAWLQSRDTRAEKAEQRAVRPEKPVDAEAQAKRAAKREERVDAGVEELRRWLRDLAQRGLADSQRESWRMWDEVAARMVDAQAPGLAIRLRRLGSLAASGTAANDRLLEEVALLYLLLEGYSRRAALGQDMDQEIRQLVGWTVPTEDVLASESIRDDWTVVGQRTVEDDRMRQQRTWLHANSSARFGLVIVFAPIGQALDSGLIVGTQIDASLAFYPGTTRTRALVAERHGEPRRVDRLPGLPLIEDGFRARAERLAQSPWIDQQPLGLCSVRPGVKGRDVFLIDAAGGSLRLDRGAKIDPWKVASLSGGHAVDVFGELERDALVPVAVAAEGRVVSLS